MSQPGDPPPRPEWQPHGYPGARRGEPDPRGPVALYLAAILWMLVAPAPAFIIFALAIALSVVEAIMVLWCALVLYCVVLAVLLVLGKRSVMLKRLTLAMAGLAGLPLAAGVLLIVWVFVS